MQRQENGNFSFVAQKTAAFIDIFLNFTLKEQSTTKILVEKNFDVKD